MNENYVKPTRAIASMNYKENVFHFDAVTGDVTC